MTNQNRPKDEYFPALAKQKFWSKQEIDELLSRVAKHQNDTEIGAALGRSATAVNAKIQALRAKGVIVAWRPNSRQKYKKQ